MLLAPSILSADMAHLADALGQCAAGGADEIHFDVMDGHFVPNLSIGIPVLRAVARNTELPVDVHLMVTNPDTLLDLYLDAGATSVSVHWEVVDHLDRLLGRIKDGGAEAGVALNPATPVEVLRDVLPLLDRVLLMSVNPGFSGQAFLPYTLDKARRLVEWNEKLGTDVLIAMDGGMGPDTIASAAEAGVRYAVAGSAVFGQDDPAAAIRRLKELAAA
jgi:ribulose-phosphate 3-epimerase